MPTPKPGESKKDYLSRCMAYPDMQNLEQAARFAKCNGMWKQAHELSDTEAITWITVGGKHIPIGAGEDKDEEIKRAFESENAVRISKNEDYVNYVSSNYDYNSIQQKQYEAMNLYGSETYKDINQKLKGKDFPEDETTFGGQKVNDMVDEQVSHLTDYIDSHPMKDDVDLYRGAVGDSYKDLKVGDEFINPGFSSFSTFEDTANTFIPRDIDSSKAVIMNIKSTKGEKVAPLIYKQPGKEAKPNTRETEFVVQRGTKFRVVDIEEKNNIRVGSVRKVTVKIVHDKYPVGTISEHKDGRKYKKISNGVWEYVRQEKK